MHLVNDDETEDAVPSLRHEHLERFGAARQELRRDKEEHCRRCVVLHPCGAAKDLPVFRLRLGKYFVQPERADETVLLIRPLKFCKLIGRESVQVLNDDDDSLLGDAGALERVRFPPARPLDEQELPRLRGVADVAERPRQVQAEKSWEMRDDV